MGLCDWQCLARGHWSRDFAYAVTAALAPDDRRKWEKDLLLRYLDRFAELTGARPDFDRSFVYYRQQMVHALLMWTITLCHSPLLPNMQLEETTRSEEHTSELQSQSKLVCRLLLEKKKKH